MTDIPDAEVEAAVAAIAAFSDTRASLETIARAALAAAAAVRAPGGWVQLPDEPMERPEYGAVLGRWETKSARCVDYVWLQGFRANDLRRYAWTHYLPHPAPPARPE
jgi:hypothetical protein